jgi:tetratricopeptide (TPR) repeat protein
MILLAGIASFSQDSRQRLIIDSLQQIADTSSGIERAKALRILASEMVRRAPNATEAYFALMREALEISEELGDTAMVIDCHCALGRELAEAGFFREGMAHAGKAMKLAPAEDYILRSNVFRTYAFAYRGLRVYDSALYFLEEARKYMPDTISCGFVASTLNDLGKIYTQMGDPLAAIEVYRQAYDALGDCPEGTNTLYALGSAARTLGYALMTAGDYRAAIHYFRVADTVYERTDKGISRNRIYHVQQASNIARVYQHWGKLDSALYYRQLAIDRFAAYGITERNMNVPNQYCYMGTIYRDQGDFARARDYFDRSLELRKQIKDSLGVGMCYDEMAEMARQQGRYLQAVEMLQEALRYKSTFGDARIDPSRMAQYTESRSETYLYLGKVFADWDKFDDALMYYDTSLMFCRPVNFTRGEALVNYYKGLAWQARGEADTATRYFDRSLSLAGSMGNEPLEARARTGLGKLFLQEGQTGAALDYFQSALETYREGGFIREIPGLYIDIGRAMVMQGRREAAIRIFEQAYQKADSMGMLREGADAAMALAGLYEGRGELVPANRYLREYLLLHDSVFSLETHRQLAEMQAHHESQQKQMQIDRLGQENELNSLRADRSQYVIISLGGILILLLLFAIILIRQIQIRNQQEAMLVRQQLFRSQMNPHFIFNSLTNIQHFIFSKDSLSAGRYLAVFAKLMRSILNNSRRETITLHEEVDTIRQYLGLQQLRLEDKLSYGIEVDDALEPEITLIPPMLAQPFIENAIEHGIKNMESGKGKVVVRIQKEDGHILYEVDDNGVGRERSGKMKAEKHSVHASTAVSLTRTRLQHLWGRKRPQGFFEIIDKEHEDGAPAGTLVRLKIPLN